MVKYFTLATYWGAISDSPLDLRAPEVMCSTGMPGCQAAQTLPTTETIRIKKCREATTAIHSSHLNMEVSGSFEMLAPSSQWTVPELAMM
jgi:hypothetical protein